MALVAIALAALAAVLWPLSARAEIIDFNPAEDQVPTILTEEELARYSALLRISRPSIASPASPDGRYVLVRISGTLRVLDTTTKETPLLELGTLSFWSPVVWTSSTESVVLAYDSASRQYGKLVIDAATRTFTNTPFTVAPLPGKSVRLTNGLRIFRRADGSFHALGYTVSQGQSVLSMERPSFDPRSPEERRELGDDQPPLSMLQTEEQMVGVSLDTGAVSPIAPLPGGTDLGSALQTFAVRPGTDTAAFVQARSLPWSGTVVGGRASRGGGMPTSYWNTQEALGFIRPEQNLNLTTRSLRLVDLNSLQTTVIQNSDLAPGMFSNSLWTADGSHLVVVVETPSLLEGRENPVYEYTSGVMLKLFDPQGRFLRDWTDSRMDTLGTSFSPLTGTRLTVLTPFNLTRHLYVVDIAGGAGSGEPVYQGARFLFAWALRGTHFAGVLGDVADPGDLYVARADDVAGSLDRVTNLNQDVRATANIKYTPVRYRTSHGVNVEGIYVYPAGWSFPPPEPMPVVVWQQGGPGGQMVNVWGTSVESPYTLLPAFGIPVFMVNGSGRQSNGAQFYSDMADGTSFGQRDIADVKEGVDHLIELDVVDPAAVGVTGCSYGGYFTLQSLVEYPSFYKAGNAQCSLNDVLWEFNFGWSPFIGYLMGSSTTANPEEYIEDSPIYNASRMAAALLLFHGTEDFLPFEHITNIHDQVVMNGVPTRFWRAEGYGHGIGSITADRTGMGQRYAAQLQIDWFRRYLGLEGGHVTGGLKLLPIRPTLPIEGTDGGIR
jgi:dipeptidyl aminopeptidase/acylaminoacyl peptidase